MARRGPAPQPTALRLVHGNPGKRPINKREPTPPIGKPRRPAWLVGDGRKAWEHLAPMLDGMRVLTKADRNALARYCELWARWLKASKLLREKGESYPVKNRDGEVVAIRALPHVKIVESLSSELRQLEREFGLTPSARSRLVTTDSRKETADDPLEQLLARRNA